MTMAELFATLVARDALPAGRVKDIKTSLTYLTQALGHPCPDQCPVDPALRDEATWSTKLDTHFAALTAQGRTMSGKTRSNTRNNLRVLFRAAEAQGLLAAPLPPVLIHKHQRTALEASWRETAPYQSSYRNSGPHGEYGLQQRDWPHDIQAGWQSYLNQCDITIREVRHTLVAENLVLYWGYLARIVGRPPTWEDLFDQGLLRGFIRWHATRLSHHPITHAGHLAVITAAMVAKVLGRPDARSLADFRNSLHPPAPLHVKRDHWVSLAEIDAAADAWLQDGRVPTPARKDTKHPGGRNAGRFQKGVILKLLVRVPLRQRNIRELKVGKNLYQDPNTKHWHLHFSGDELKIGMRGQRVNEYKLDLSAYFPDLILVLEEFLTTYRPKLPNAAESKYLFLTSCAGRPFSQEGLALELRTAVGMRTDPPKRFYPHLLRTIWATECLENTKDVTLAATMLGDTPATVMRTYHDVLDTDQHAKAAAFLSSALRAG
jgi:hypothetical protein